MTSAKLCLTTLVCLVLQVPMSLFSFAFSNDIVQCMDTLLTQYGLRLLSWIVPFIWEIPVWAATQITPFQRTFQDLFKTMTLPRTIQSSTYETEEKTSSIAWTEFFSGRLRNEDTTWINFRFSKQHNHLMIPIKSRELASSTSAGQEIESPTATVPAVSAAPIRKWRASASPVSVSNPVKRKRHRRRCFYCLEAYKDGDKLKRCSRFVDGTDIYTQHQCISWGVALCNTNYPTNTGP